MQVRREQTKRTRHAEIVIKSDWVAGKYPLKCYKRDDLFQEPEPDPGCPIFVASA